MRPNSFVLLIVATLMGVGAAFLAHNWLEQQRATPNTIVMADTKARKVVVAAQPLRFGTELTSVNLKEVEWPAGAVPAGSFSSVAELIKAGERRVALAAIERDEALLSWKITGPGQRGSLSAVIGGDNKAVTIRVNDVFGVAGFVLPGDRVDVLLTRTEDKSDYTDVLLQNVRALAVDQLADERTEKPSVAKAVTLEVTTDEAQKLALASTVGSLSLALRSAGTTTVATTRRIGTANLGEREARSQSATVAVIMRAMERKEYSVTPERRPSQVQ
jgi:pilus assembly protein CpaB